MRTLVWGKINLIGSMCLAMLLGLPVLASGGRPWEGEAFSADPQVLAKAVAGLEPDEASPVQVLVSDYRYLYGEDGRCDRVIRWMYVIQDEDGVRDWSQTQASWAPWYEDRPVVRARVIGKDGSEVWLDEANVMEVAQDGTGDDIYSDRRTLSAPFPAVQIGSIVEEMIEIKGSRPYFAAGTSEQWDLTGYQKQKMRRMMVEVPKSLPFHFRVRGEGELEPEIEKQNGRIRYTFTIQDAPEGDPKDPNLPYSMPKEPVVNFSTGKSWGAIASAYKAIVDGQLEGETFDWVPADLHIGNEPFQTAVNVCHWLNSQVRYTGWELGESALVPVRPSVCMERGYGDCKDKALLVAGALRHFGFKAEIALLRSGFDYDVDPETPGVGRFNHAIVAIIDGKKIHWVDPTDSFTRDGSLHPANQGRWALIASQKQKNLVKISESKASDNFVKEKRIYTFAEADDSSVTEQTIYGGYLETMMRRSFESVEEADLKAQLEGYGTSTYRNAVIEKASKTKSKDYAKPFQIDLKLTQVGRMETGDLKSFVGVMFEDVLAYLPDDLKQSDEDREDPFVFSYPQSYEIEYRIKPLTGFRWVPDQTERTIALGTGELKFKAVEEPSGEVVAALSFNSGPRTISAEEFNRYRADLETLAEDNHALLLFRHQGDILFAEGRYGESMAVYRDLAAKHPDQPMHGIRYAQALMKAGLGDRAIAVAKQTCQNGPDSAQAYQALGEILKMDQIGRQYGHGYDREGAIAAFKKALELDPEAPLARADLAILLEFDADGIRYNNQEDLKKALAYYLESREKFPDLDLSANLLNNLIYSRNFGKMLEEAERTEDKNQKAFLEVLATTGLQGPEAGLAEAEKISDDARRRSTLEACGNQMLQYRNYPAGVALLRASARGSSKAQEIESRVQIFSQMTAIDAGDFEEVKTPLDLIRKITFGVASSKGVDFSLVKACLTEAYYERDTDVDNPISSAQVYHSLKKMASDLSLPLEMFSDLMLNLIRLETKGNAEIGFHSEVRLPGAESDLGNAIYIVNTEDGLKGYADREEFDLIGRKVIEFIDAGQLEAAEKWLEWYIGDTGGPSLRPKSQSPSPLQVWNEGDGPGKDRMRAFANMLIIGYEFDERAYQDLASFANSLEGRAREAVEISLAEADFERKKYEKAVPVFSKYFQKYPRDEDMFDMLVRSKVFAGKFDGVDALFERFLTEANHDEKIAASVLRANVYVTAGDIKAAIEHLKTAIGQGLEGPVIYNQMAWMTLFQPGYEEESQTWIAKAFQRQNTDASYGHTQAVIFAERGRCVEAKQTIMSVLKESNRLEPRPVDWYVYGRLAENYGELAEAVKLYKRVVPNEDPSIARISTYRLAQQRIAALQKGDL